MNGHKDDESNLDKSPFPMGASINDTDEFLINAIHQFRGDRVTKPSLSENPENIMPKAFEDEFLPPRTGQHEETHTEKYNQTEFWNKIMQDTEKVSFKEKAFPPARVRRLMREVSDRKHIKAETVEVMSRACELFILDLTTRASTIVMNDKRKVLRKDDIVDAIVSDETFDFLIDLLPQGTQ